MHVSRDTSLSDTHSPHQRCCGPPVFGYREGLTPAFNSHRRKPASPFRHQSLVVPVPAVVHSLCFLFDHPPPSSDLTWNDLKLHSKLASILEGVFSAFSVLLIYSPPAILIFFPVQSRVLNASETGQVLQLLCLCWLPFHISSNTPAWNTPDSPHLGPHLGPWAQEENHRANQALGATTHMVKNTSPMF